MDTQTLVASKRKFKSTQLFVVAGTILVSLLISVLCVGLTVRYEVDTETADVKSIEYWKLSLPAEQNLWYEKGIDELKSIVLKKEQLNDVENVIIFVTEGVSSDILSTARLQSSGNRVVMHDFVWDSFPHVGILKSSCSFKEKCDVFTLASALFGGVETSKGLGGLDRRVNVGDCHKALNETYHIHSILQQAKTSNMRTGFVTTGSVAGALAAGLYAHSSNSKWLCDGYIPQVSLKANCIDVATQLLKSEEGRQINVIMGGGRQALVSKFPIPNRTITEESACVSRDGRNLLQDWQSYMSQRNASYKLIQTPRGLERLKGSSCDHVLGLFANGDLPVAGPNLTSLVAKALDVLQRAHTGYILVAETAINTDGAGIFQKSLWSLDETIRDVLKHPRFTSNNTVLLTVFLGRSNNDIHLYATGPQSYLFHGVHEVTYMAHVISYALKMGIYGSSKSGKRTFKL